VEVSEDGEDWRNAYIWQLVGKSNRGRGYYCESDAYTHAWFKYIRLPEVDKARQQAEFFISTIEFPDKNLKELCLKEVINGIEWGRNNPKTK